MKTIAISVASLAMVSLAGPASAASRPSMAPVIQDVLYRQVDAAIAASTAPADGITVEPVTDLDPDDLSADGLAPVPAARSFELEELLTPKQRLHRMVQLLRGLPFHTVEQQVNDLLSTVYSLQI